MAKPIKKKDWILEKLSEHNYELEPVLSESMYTDFIKDTDSNSSYLSYRKAIHLYYNQLMADGESDLTETKEEQAKEQEREKEKYAEYDEEYLISLLEAKSKKLKKPFQMDDVRDLAAEVSIPYKAFLYQIPDLKQVLKSIYEMNLFHIQTDKKVNKVEHENKKIRKELDFYKTRQIQDEKLVSILEQVVEEYEPFEFKPSNINVKNFKDNAESVILASDWHWDEVVDYEEMLGLNAYSVSISRKRIDKLFRKVLENNKIFGTNVLNILFLGDMISGTLHDLAENSELGVTKGIIELADYTAQHIQNLSKHFAKIKALGLVGNHPRHHIKPRYKHKQRQNHEYILYEFIKRETKNIVEFDIPESHMKLHEIVGHEFLSLHGDVIKGGNGLNSVPGNLSRDISLLGGTLNQIDKSFEYVNMGHFHSSNITKSFSGAKIIMNGSLIGPNEFSLGALKKGEQPTQTYYVVDEENGVRFVDELKLGDKYQ